MSTSASRKLPADVLAHPDIVALVEQGKTSGNVTAQALRAATDEHHLSASQLKSLMRFLSEEGISVVMSAEDTRARKRVAAAATRKSTVKAPAKKAAAKKAPVKKTTPAKKAAATVTEPEPTAKKTAASKSTATKSTAKAPAKKTTPAKKAAAASDTAAAEETVAPIIGPDGKKILPDVPDEQFEKDLATDPSIKEDEKEAANAGFVVSSADESDEPEQQVMVAGATADPVKDYLKQIGKVPLLNAEMEVELAKRIEAGLFSEEKLAKGGKISEKVREELEWIAEDGRRAKNHLLEANLRLVVSLAKRYTGRGMPAFSTHSSMMARSNERTSSTCRRTLSHSASICLAEKRIIISSREISSCVFRYGLLREPWRVSDFICLA